MCSYSSFDFGPGGGGGGGGGEVVVAEGRENGLLSFARNVMSSLKHSRYKSLHFINFYILGVVVQLRSVYLASQLI